MVTAENEHKKWIMSKLGNLKMTHQPLLPGSVIQNHKSKSTYPVLNYGETIITEIRFCSVALISSNPYAYGFGLKTEEAPKTAHFSYPSGLF